jgi:hypothetical protein
MSEYKLTKSSIISGIQCPKKLWREKNIPTEKQPISTVLQSRFDSGHEVGKAGREEYSDGMLILAKDVDSALAQTAHFIKENVPCIFEAAFLFNDLYVRTDVLKRSENGSWHLIEIKSGTKVKDEYVYDAAIQFYCAKGSGLPIEKVFVKYINNKCIFPDLENLFSIEEITPKVTALQLEIEQKLSDLKNVISASEPDVIIGDHCDKPYECEYKDLCWKDVPKKSIFNIPGLKWDKKNELVENNILAIEQIPPSFHLSGNQRTFIEKMIAGNPEVNIADIALRLSELTYPIYFLDFETVNPAIPRFEGTNPYQQCPFQYSCHIMTADGEINHTEFLQITLDDPRKEFAEHLISDLGSTGSIVSYNATFEKSVIKILANYYPDLSAPLLALEPRFWDQLELMRKDYFHPDFNGSFSIKNVLPVIDPSLNYHQLQDVHDGAEAGVVWNKALAESDEELRNKAFSNLKAYCELDTKAMVQIHRHLEKLCKQS